MKGRPRGPGGRLFSDFTLDLWRSDATMISIGIIPRRKMLIVLISMLEDHLNVEEMRVKIKKKR